MTSSEYAPLSSRFSPNESRICCIHGPPWRRFQGRGCNSARGRGMSGAPEVLISLDRRAMRNQTCLDRKGLYPAVVEKKPCGLMCMCMYIYIYVYITLSPIVAVFQWTTEVGLLPDLHGHGHEGEIVGDGILDLLWHRSIGRQDVPCKFPRLVWSWWVHVASQSCTATKHCSQKTRLCSEPKYSW